MKRLLVAMVAMAVTVAGCDDPPRRELVIHAGRVVDGTGGPVTTDQRITIRDGLIEAIVPDDDSLPPVGAAVVDARDATVMPGIVDAHTHMYGAPACTLGLGVGIGQAVRNARAQLAAGVTTVADLGSMPAAAIALRRWVGTGRHRGPRVLVAGAVVTAPGGYPVELMGEEAVEAGVIAQVADAASARAAVEKLAAAGVDLIKVAVQEQTYAGEPVPVLEGEVLCAAVEEAHRHELRVVGHTVSARSYTTARDCGVDGHVHGALEALPDATIQRLADDDVPVTPTLYVFDAFDYGPGHPEYLELPHVRRFVTEEVIDDMRAFAKRYNASETLIPHPVAEGVSKQTLRDRVADNFENTRKLHAAGVPLAFGTDGSICFNVLGRPFEEMRRLEHAGIPRLEVLRIATGGGARMLNLHDALGRLEVGYRGDLIVVDGNPDESLEAIDNVLHVVIDGVVQRVDDPSWTETVGLSWEILWTMLFG